eukprot:3098475-Pleurochrysis_carterae.AAC.2
MTRSLIAQSKCHKARRRRAEARPTEGKASVVQRAKENQCILGSEAVGASAFSPRNSAPKAR